MRRIAALVASLFAFIPAAASAALHAGDAAPAFALPRTRGAGVSLAASAGKPLYLNFFASWCSPCNEEAPAVAALYRKYHRRGLSIVAIDEQEVRSKAIEFARKYGWLFPVGIDGEGDVGKKYGVIVLPVHVFVDRSGKVSTYRLGEMSAAEIEDAIKKVL